MTNVPKFTNSVKFRNWLICQNFKVDEFSKNVKKIEKFAKILKITNSPKFEVNKFAEISKIDKISKNFKNR